jgi:uncharacterized NAD(P)/FAD-binding protein YdhS
MAFGGVTTVVVVGGGCSGTLLAAALSAGSADHPCEIVVIEPGEKPGRGVAYGTRCSSHLLNVPAEQMSAHQERPSHFATWAHQRDPHLSRRSFVPRMLYGEYLESVWCEAQLQAAPGSSLAHIRSTVSSATCTPDGKRLRVGLASGAFVDADHVVLAMGNLPSRAAAPGETGIAASPRYVVDPWRAGALDGISGSVLLIGTGLTAIDVTFALVDRGVTGPIRAVSRHGLLPRPHRPDAIPAPPSHAVPTERTVRSLIALLRRNAGEHGDWRLAIDEFRPHVAEVWRSLPDVERRRFMRHAARFWEIHRHRMAPEVAIRAGHLMASHRLSVSAGRIEGHRDLPDGVEVAVRRRGATRADLFAASYVINCTGPQLRVSDAGNPLIDGLMSSGLVRPGAYGLGLDVTEDGAVIGANGVRSRNLWTIGPLRRGVEWETTAAREIRAQAGALALRVSSPPTAGVAPSPSSPAVHSASQQLMQTVALAVVPADIQRAGVL